MESEVVVWLCAWSFRLNQTYTSQTTPFAYFFFSFSSIFFPFSIFFFNLQQSLLSF
ncbi:hypothetical protein Hanom_Chr03g00250191 [Helianthus anomalus]